MLYEINNNLDFKVHIVVIKNPAREWKRRRNVLNFLPQIEATEKMQYSLGFDGEIQAAELFTEVLDYLVQ